MFHSGIHLPDYLKYTFSQIRKFNPSLNIHFITDREHLDNPVFEAFKILTYDKLEYYSNKIKEFEIVYHRSSTDFWTLAATRLIYIENFLDKHSMEDVYHFENDVLLYYDLSTLHDTFLRLFENMAITVAGPDKCMTGFMFITSSDPLCRMTQFFIDSIRTNGVTGLKNRYEMDMVNEMTLMRAYGKEKGLNELNHLPTLPFGDCSSYFDEFVSVFDPASWGQFVGGTTDKVPGAKPQDHYIGQLLTRCPKYHVSWYKDTEGRIIPCFEWDREITKINNLHIHSKELHKYMS